MNKQDISGIAKEKYPALFELGQEGRDRLELDLHKYPTWVWAARMADNYISAATNGEIHGDNRRAMEESIIDRLYLKGLAEIVENAALEAGGREMQHYIISYAADGRDYYYFNRIANLPFSEDNFFWAYLNFLNRLVENKTFRERVI